MFEHTRGRKLWHGGWIMFCWWLQTTLQWTIALQGRRTKHFLVSLFAFHISESWKGSYYRDDTAESLPITADMMLISLMLLGKLFSTFVSPIICAKGTVPFLWVSQWISGSRRLPWGSLVCLCEDWFQKAEISPAWEFCLWSPVIHSKMILCL